MTFELDNVELSFQEKRILYGIYLKAETGSITGLLGANGSGKTSLLRIFFGNLSCNNKQVRINGEGTLKDLYKLNSVKLLSQSDFLPSKLTILKLFKIYSVDFDYFIKKFPSFKKLHKHKIKKLSGGERRLIATWLTIKADSALILMDEPFTHLTPVYIEILKEELIKEKETKAIVLTDHLYEDLIEISDSLYFLKGGCCQQIQEKGELSRLGYCY